MAVILGCMSFAILLAEATILPSGVDLSLFSILVHAAGQQEVLVQVIIFVDLFQCVISSKESLFFSSEFLISVKAQAICFA